MGTLTLLLAVAAAVQTPAAQAVNVVDQAFKGQPTEVMVLGTPHLSQLDERFKADRLEPLIARLAAWKPAVVTVENPTGRDCDEAAARPDLFGRDVDRYCQDAATARTALGVSQTGAEAAIDAVLDQPAAERAPVERRRLAALFFAAGDPSSALVQWLRLPAAEQKADAVLPEALVIRLGRIAASRNESHALAARVAVRAGLERVHPVDDYSGSRITSPYTKALSDRIDAIWNNAHVKAQETASKAATERLLTGGDIFAFYRWTNDPRTLANKMRGDFAAAAADTGADRAGRRYLAYWETRNLRMVANIRHAYGKHAGERVLSVVGSSHKPYFERYLGMLSDTRIVDAAAVLR